MAFQSIEMVLGDNLVDVSALLTDAAGEVADLSGSTLTFKMWLARAPYTVLIDHAAVIDSTVTGAVHYSWQEGDLEDVTRKTICHAAFIQTKTSNGKTLSFPGNGDVFQVTLHPQR